MKMKYLNEAKEIWQKFVPRAGQSETVQGEMLRAVEKLRDEAQRNGNRNWDKGFVTLLNFLGEKLRDPRVFEASAIEHSQSILLRLSNFEEACLEDALYDELADRVVEYFKYYGSTPHEKDPLLRR